MGVRITINDIRAARMCARAARPWFIAHGLNWSDFLANGIDADVIRATNDTLALKVVAIAEERANGK